MDQLVLVISVWFLGVGAVLAVWALDAAGHASTRAALCKDPEGAIENLMEGYTIEEVIEMMTWEQAQTRQ